MLREGQVLWLVFRFNNRPGDISKTEHPYVIYEIDKSLNCVELIQLDKIDGKMHKAYREENHFIDASSEEVISEHSFAQLDNCFKVELSDALESFRETEDSMSPEQYGELKRQYLLYKLQHYISENKTVYLSTKELMSLNSEE